MVTEHVQFLLIESDLLSDSKASARFFLFLSALAIKSFTYMVRQNSTNGTVRLTITPITADLRIARRKRGHALYFVHGT
jgi:hypothetical protein